METRHALSCLAPVLLLTACAGTDARPVYVTTSPEPRSVSVSGEAELKVAPDEAVMTVGVETPDPTLQAAKARNDEAVKRVLAAAVAAGVESRHIQTEYVEIEPRYKDYDRKEIVSFVARKAVVVTIKHLDRFEAIVAGVLDAGANILQGIQFK